MSMCSYESYQLCIHSWWIMLCCNCRKLPTTCTTKTTAPNVWPRVAGSKPRLAARPPVCLHLRPLAVQWMKAAAGEGGRVAQDARDGCGHAGADQATVRLKSSVTCFQPESVTQSKKIWENLFINYFRKIISDLNLQIFLGVILFLNVLPLMQPL